MVITPAETVAPAPTTRFLAKSLSTETTSTQSASSDRVSISDTARTLQQKDDWQSSLANRRDGVPRLIPVESAITGGVESLQNELGQWLKNQGLDQNANFSLTYDAANRSFNVTGPSQIKNALEQELNGNSPSPVGNTLRESYALLEDMTSSLASVRQQFAMDQAAGGYDSPSRERGFRYDFSLEMVAGRLAAN